MADTPLIIQTIIFALAAGVVCQIISEWLKTPSIFFLLAAGVLLGPHVADIIDPAKISNGLLIIIELGVALILFEGSVFLHLDEFRLIRGPIRRLLSLGAAITFVGATLSAWLIIGLPFRYSIVFGALMIVTGPTVISPIIKRLPLKTKVATLLNWESVLLDPIGAVLAISFMEFLIAKDTVWWKSLWQFFWIIIAGLGVGFVVGWAIRFFIRKNESLSQVSLNMSILAGAMLAFGLSHLIAPHSGLLSVVIAGMVLANCEVFTQKSGIAEFNGTISSLVVSFLFVLLAAKLNVYDLLSFGERGWWLLGVMLLVIRPLSIFLATRGSSLALGEKLFLSWMAPRGIVAASTASLLVLIFVKQGYADAAPLEALTYLVIVATVVLHGLPAGLTARLFRALEAERSGYLIIGAHILGRTIGRWLSEQGLEVKLVDTNPRYVRKARSEGLLAFHGNALDPGELQNLEIKRMGKLLALTSNDEVNMLVSQLGNKLLGNKAAYQLSLKALGEPHELAKELGGTPILPGLAYLEEVKQGFSTGRYEWRALEIPTDVIYNGPIETSQGHYWPLFLAKKPKAGPLQAKDKLKSGDLTIGIIKKN